MPGSADGLVMGWKQRGMKPGSGKRAWPSTEMLVCVCVGIAVR